MSKTILITGSSSGIGEETVRLFQSKGWKVAATMRTPEKRTDLAKIVDVKCYALDVTKPESIKSAIGSAISDFGSIDAIVNNAGYGLVGAFEDSDEEQIQRQFDTNVFGLMRVCREILPHFRERGKGTIVNITSVGGRITFPLYSLYHSTKWAVEGFTESLQHELRPFNIKVKLVEPGPIKTDFYDRSMDANVASEGSPYFDYVSDIFPKMQKAGENAPGPEVVAEAIYNAVTDGSRKLRYSANSRTLLLLRKFLPDPAFFWLVRSAIKR